MPTTTKPSTELAKLVKESKASHAALAAANDEKNAYIEEVRALFQDPKSDPEKVKALTGGSPFPDQWPYPKQAELDKLKASFHAAAEAEEVFRRENIGALLEEQRPEFEEAKAQIEEAFQALADGTRTYRHVFETAVAYVRDTGGINSQHIAEDRRPAEWHEIARVTLAALEQNPLELPVLNELGNWKLAQAV